MLRIHLELPPVRRFRLLCVPIPARLAIRIDPPDLKPCIRMPGIHFHQLLIGIQFLCIANRPVSPCEVDVGLDKSAVRLVRAPEIPDRPIQHPVRIPEYQPQSVQRRRVVLPLSQRLAKGFLRRFQVASLQVNVAQSHIGREMFFVQPDCALKPRGLGGQ